MDKWNWLKQQVASRIPDVSEDPKEMGKLQAYTEVMKLITQADVEYGHIETFGNRGKLALAKDGLDLINETRDKTIESMQKVAEISRFPGTNATSDEAAGE